MPPRANPTNAVSGGKLCRGCERVKPLAEFFRCSKAPDGLQWWCRTCKRIAKAGRYERMREHGVRISPERAARKAAAEARRRQDEHVRARRRDLRRTELGKVTSRLNSLRSYHRKTGSPETAEAIRLMEEQRRHIREELGMEPSDRRAWA